jgi:hypothetical protein
MGLRSEKRTFLIGLLFFTILNGAEALVTGEKIKVMASHVGPVNNPSEVSSWG